jgi:predicted dehydrogenase
MAVKQRVIVVGLGSIGCRHARLLRARPDIEVALCDTNTTALSQVQEHLGIATVYTTFEAALNTQPDMLVIATPHNLHAAQTIQALDAGIHVLCEKPMSDSLASAYQMQAAAHRSDRVLAFGFHLHFHPALRRLKQMIEDGQLGTILHAHCRVGSYITLANSISRYQQRMFGALLLDYAHQPDLLYWLLNQKPTVVHAHALQAGHLEFTADPNVLLITGEYDTPLLTTIHLNYVQMPERHEYEIIGDKGWVILDVNAAHLRHGDRAANQIVEERFSVERDDLYTAEHQAFLDAAAGKSRPESTADTAIVSMEVFDAVIRSLAAGMAQKEKT